MHAYIFFQSYYHTDIILKIKSEEGKRRARGRRERTSARRGPSGVRAGASSWPAAGGGGRGRAPPFPPWRPAPSPSPSARPAAASASAASAAGGGTPSARPCTR